MIHTENEYKKVEVDGACIRRDILYNQRADLLIYYIFPLNNNNNNNKSQQNILNIE